MFDKPIHTDGLSAPQLLLPSLIELCNNFLSFLLEELRQISQFSKVLQIQIGIFHFAQSLIYQKPFFNLLSPT